MIRSGLFAPRRRHGLFAVARDDHLVARLLQVVRQHIDDGRFVVDDQDFGHGLIVVQMPRGVNRLCDRMMTNV